METKPRAFKIFTLVLLLVLVTAVFTNLAGARGADNALPAATESSAPFALASETAVVYGVSETGLYVITFADPALPSYKGGIAGLAATSPEVTGARRLDGQSPAALAYTEYLLQKQAQFTAAMEQSLGRSVEVVFNYTAALNGLAARISHEEALQIAKMDGVTAVYGDTLGELTTEVGPLHIGAANIWNGATGPGVATRGEGVIIGVIDSGINSQHPSFAATDGDGYTHTNPYGAGVYRGWCVANPSFCNSKLVGAYGLNPVGGTPEDTDGHGSHTASTSGGNKHTASFSVGPTPYNIELSGVAPRANIVAYKVCNPTCPGTASVAAVNSAIANDQVDVLNYSISGVDNPWIDPTDQAFLNATNAGIFVSASAGNSGPGPSTVAKTGPWNASVAASTINRIVANTVDVTGPTTPPALQGMAAVPGENTSLMSDLTAPIRYNPANNDGCTAFSAGYFSGAMALIQRGGCTFLVKINNAAAAGAVGVIIFNNVGGPPISMGGGLPATPPAFMLDLTDGTALRDYIIANPTATARANAATSYIVNNDWEDIVAGFSSRGPSQFEILKPDYIAPGVNILAAVATAGGNPAQYGFYQGTSMSSPHGAGAAALMMALYPSWTPPEVKSALASTATGGLLKENGVTPADPFDVGSGLLALGGAGTVGLVFNETGANYAAANPAIGGDPKTLNQPSVVNYNCGGVCTWTRTVKSVLPTAATYTASFSGPAGMNVTVTPSTFTINPGDEQVLTISADVTSLPLNVFAFGVVTLETATNWPNGSNPAAVTNLLDEQFTDTAFPPAGWAVYKLLGGGTTTWIRDTAQSYSPPASARRIYGLSGDGNQDDWLVTPPLTLNGSVLTYYDRGQWMADYGYSGVWISTGSCNPADNQFVELLETSDIPNNAWRATPVTIDLSAYDGQTACLAFRYGGTFAHTWWIDDVLVTSQTTGLPVAATNIPVVVRPTDAVANINVTPSSLSSTQAPNTTVNRTLTIANTGTAPLTWNIVEAPLAMRLELTPEGPDAPEAPIMLAVDDGVGENAIGLTSGGQFLWLNRFTPTLGQFPVTLDRVDIMFGYPPANSGGVNVGELIDIYLYEDADGNPANGATHRASLTNQAVQAVNGTTWSTYNLSSPVTFNGPGDILIAVVNRTAGVAAGTFPAVIDQTPPSQQRSWAGFGAVPGDPPVLPLPTFALIDSFGLAGNWLVRGFGTSGAACDNPADVPWLSASPTGGTLAGGGSTNVNVTLNSTSLAVGTYNALLCVNSNDPDTPLVEVPVTLTVEDVTDAPDIDVDPLSLASTQPTNTTTQQTLSIGNVGNLDLTWQIFEDATAAPENVVWSDNFDSYATGSQMHGQGGWKGWFNDPTAGALTSNAQARSNPNSVAILGASDLVHEYSATDGQWVYTAWQYVPTDFTGQSYFIMLNTYNDAGTTLNWSTQVMFNGTTNQVLNDGGVSGGTLPLVRGQWVELRLEIDLDADTGAFYYNNQLLYSGTWSGQVSGSGATSIGAVDLFANNASVIYYDDMSLEDVTGPAACDAPEDIPWLSVAPTSGTTAPGATTPVEVTFDSTGLADGTYSGNLCVTSNDPDPGPGNGTDLVIVPVTLTVADQPPTIEVDPLSLSAIQVTNATTQQTLTIANVGGGSLDWTIDEEDTTAFPAIGPVTLVPQPATENVGAPEVAAPASVAGNVALWQGPTAVLYDNGPLVTNPGAGFNGADASVLQTNLGLSTFGFGHAVTSGFRVADDFTVPAGPGWIIDSITFFAYQTGSTTVSTINAVNLRIWDGVPGAAGSNIIFGDTTTNLLSNTAFMNAYRVTDTALLGNTRPLMANTAAVSLYLAPGTYWLDWQTGGTLASGPWAPPVSILGQTAKPGSNGLQFDPTTSTWNPLLDTGAAAVQDLPFIIQGTEGVLECAVPSDISWLSLDVTSGSNAGGTSTDVTVTFDSTGLPLGTYTGNLCINSNDPATPLVVVPVELTVAEPAYLRVAHLAPFAADASVTVTLNGAPALTDFNYGDSTTYLTLPAGTYDVAVFPTGSGTPAITATVTLDPDTYYSAVATGDGANQPLALLALVDDNTAPAAGFFHLRLGHLAPFASGAALADIRLQDGTPVLTNVAYGDVTSYIPLPAGTYDLKITTPGGGTTLIDPLPVTLPEGALVTAFATGEGSNQDLGAFAWLVDLEGFFLPLTTYGVALSPATAAQSGAPGEVVTYTLTVTNTGNVTDTFTIALSGNSWTSSAPASITLGAGASGTVVVTVAIPASAANNASDSVTVTVTSAGDGTVTASSELTTTAVVTGYVLYLPFITKP